MENIKKLMDIASIVLIVLSVSTSTYCIKVSYDNYKVFRIIPMNNEQIEVLRNLENINGYSFWIEPCQVSQFVDLQVAPIKLTEFYELMKNTGIQYTIFIENLQNKLNNQIITFNSRAGNDRFEWTSYHTLEEIYSWMDGIASAHSGIAKKIIGGETYQRRKIQGLRLRFGSRKPGIFIEGGMHPLEWISPATVTYLIERLLLSPARAVRQLAESYDWYIFPICNPDGYKYTEVDRMWRKSVSDNGVGSDPRCRGVDLNRNFGYMWQKNMRPNTDPCSDRYPGLGAFSEIETKSLSNYIKTLKGSIFAYLSFHSYGQSLIIPYSYTNQHLENYEELHAIGTRATAVLSRRHHTRYSLGNLPELSHTATGTSMDWVKGIMALPLVYTYIMRGTEEHGVLLPPDQIIPNGEEVLDSLVEMFLEASKLGYDQSKGSRPGSGPGESSGSGSSGSRKSKFKLPMCLGG